MFCNLALFSIQSAKNGLKLSIHLPSMPPMKTYSYVLSWLLVTLFTFSASAMSGYSLQQGSLFNGDSTAAYDTMHDGGPRALSVGAYVATQKRGMQNGNRVDDWEINHMIGYLGLDLTPWLTILGGVGQSELSIQNDNRDSDFEWLGAVQMRMLDYMVLDPLLDQNACWFAIDAEVRGIGSSSEGVNSDVTWLELFGSLTMSLTVHPERGGFMDRISIFAGPAYSAITATEDGGFNADLNEDKATGFVGGIQFNPSENVALRLEYQDFDSGSVGGSLTFHF